MTRKADQADYSARMHRVFEHIDRQTIPGGQYAITAFRGTVEQVGAVWEAMLRDWLPKSGMQLDERPFFEYYPTDSRFDAKTGIFTCDIAIPVAPL